MSHFVEGNFKTFRVGAADIPAGTAVKLTAGLLVAAAAATDKIIGVVEAKAYLTKLIDVHLRSAAGTISIVLGGTVAAGDAVTANASGLGITTTTAADQIIGYALEAGTAGKTIELMPSTAKV
jgi:hypothetical protein